MIVESSTEGQGGALVCLVERGHFGYDGCTGSPRGSVGDGGVCSVRRCVSGC